VAARLPGNHKPLISMSKNKKKKKKKKKEE
jgi:hypothetical protein